MATGYEDRHYGRIANAAEQLFNSRTRVMGGTHNNWAESQLHNALIDARNDGLAINTHQVKQRVEDAVAANNPALFREHLPGVKLPPATVHVLEEAVEHAPPVVAHVAEEIALDTRVAARPNLWQGLVSRVRGWLPSPVPRDNSVNMREPHVLRASDIAAPTAPELELTHVAPVAETPLVAEPAKVFTSRKAALKGGVSGTAIKTALASHADPLLKPASGFMQSLTPPEGFVDDGHVVDPFARETEKVVISAEEKAGRFAAVREARATRLAKAAEPAAEAVAMVAEAPARTGINFAQRIRGATMGAALSTANPTLPGVDFSGRKLWRGAPLEPTTQLNLREMPVAPASPVPISMKLRTPTPVETPAREMFGPPAPKWRKLSIEPFGPPKPQSRALVPVGPVRDVLEEAEQAKPTGFFARAWARVKGLFTRKPAEVAPAVPQTSAPIVAEVVESAPVLHNSIKLPEIKAVAQEAEKGGRTGLIVAGTLAAVGGAAWLASGNHQQREYQRRLDAAGLANDQAR